MRTAIAAAVLGSVALLIASNGIVQAAQPDPETYALPLQPCQVLLTDMYLRTRRCMRVAGFAARSRGNNAARSQEFMVAVCGSSLLSFFRRDMSEEEAQSAVKQLAHLSYFEDVLQAPEPLVNVN